MHPFALNSRGRSLNPSFLTKESRAYSSSCLHNAASFYDDFFDEDEDDEDFEDDDDMIDPDSLGDWRDFRRNLAQSIPSDEEDEESFSAGATSSNENEEVLFSQNEDLAEEYRNNAWAHEVATVS